MQDGLPKECSVNCKYCGGRLPKGENIHQCLDGGEAMRAEWRKKFEPKRRIVEQTTHANGTVVTVFEET